METEAKVLSVAELSNLKVADKVKSSTGDKSKLEDGRTKASYNFVPTLSDDGKTLTIVVSLDYEKVGPELKGTSLFYARGAGWNAKTFDIPVNVSLNVYKTKVRV